MEFLEIKSGGPFVGPPQLERKVVQKEISVLNAVSVPTGLTRAIKPKMTYPIWGLSNNFTHVSRRWFRGNSLNTWDFGRTIRPKTISESVKKFYTWNSFGNRTLQVKALTRVAPNLHESDRVVSGSGVSLVVTPGGEHEAKKK